MMDNTMGEERHKTCFDNLYDGQYQEWGRAERIFEHISWVRKEIKHVSTTCMINNIMGMERDKTCFDNCYDGNYIVCEERHQTCFGNWYVGHYHG